MELVGKLDDCRVPHHIIFARLHQHLCENGKLMKQIVDCGRPRAVRTVQIVKQLIAESPEPSTQKIAIIFSISKSTVFQILNEKQIYSFYIQRVHVLLLFS